MGITYCYPYGKTKALTMSFDDGRIQDVRLTDILRKNGIRATFFLNAGKLGTPGYVRKEEIDIYEDQEIGSHTYHHVVPDRICPSLFASEVMDDRKELESLTGRIINGFAVPCSRITDEEMALLPGLGIQYVRQGDFDSSLQPPHNLMYWASTCHYTDTKLFDLGKKLLDEKKRDYLQLMSVRGHSYEFDNYGNWDIIENFSLYMSKHDDIWYATLGEIASYLKAMNCLRFSALGNAVENPSAKDIWIEVNGNPVRIPGGQYVTLTRM